MDGKAITAGVLALAALAFAAGLVWADAGAAGGADGRDVETAASGSGGEEAKEDPMAGESETARGEAAEPDSVEIREYQGLPLDTFFRAYDNSIKGPQHVDVETYRLEITGLVEEPQALRYDEVLALGTERRLVTLYCVEGWRERLVFEGVALEKILERAAPVPSAATLILHAVDGYSTSLPYEDVERLDLMLASKINGRVLDEVRGFPFQLVAESKLGYKWIKWVTRIELSDAPYEGFWERRGYPNEADVPDRWLKSEGAP
jgi:DMSO/TMAO reductase YedYZ molybdopterin-dependent catalytic subunit